MQQQEQTKSSFFFNMDQVEHKFQSDVLVHSTRVSWTLKGVDELLQSNAWTCTSCLIDVPLGVHNVSKWRVSLFTNSSSMSEDNMMYAKGHLLVPSDRKVTYQLTVKPVKNEEIIHGLSDQQQCQETSFKEVPRMWRVGSLSQIMDCCTDDNSLQFWIELTVWDTDLYSV